MIQVTHFDFQHISLLLMPILKNLGNPIRSPSSLELYLKTTKNKHLLVHLPIFLSPLSHHPLATNVTHFHRNPAPTLQCPDII